MDLRHIDDTRRMGWALALVIGLLLLPQFAVGLFASEIGRVAFMQDDSFYYAEIARRFAADGLVTFDGINPTNGFHPLWFLIVSAITTVLPDAFLLNGIYVMHVALVGLGAWIFAIQIKGMSVWGRIILLAVFLHPVVSRTLWVNAGMESSLAFAAAAWTMHAFYTATSAGYRNHRANWLFGLASAALMLTRLDSVIIVFPLAIWAALSVLREPGAFSRLISLFVIPVAFCSAYLALNLWSTGHLTPVSSAAKRTFTLPWWTSLHTITYGWNSRYIVLAATPLIVSLAGLFIALFSKLRGDAALRTAFLLAGVGVSIFYVYLAFFAPNAFNWYLAAAIGVAAWVAGRIVAVTPDIPTPRWATRRVLPVISVVFALYVIDDLKDRVEFAWGTDPSLIGGADLMQLGLRLSELSNEGDIAAMHDSGKVGYFADIPVVNLDGLANSYDFLENVRGTGNYREYFDLIGVTHLLLRDLYLTDMERVLANDYQTTAFTADPRIAFSRDDELYRRTVAEGFTVVVFRYPGSIENASPGK